MNKLSLETQYRGFNICFWVMLVLATLNAAFNPILAITLGTLGLVSGAIGQLKLILINQEIFLENQVKFLANQELFKAGLNKLLEK